MQRKELNPQIIWSSFLSYLPNFLWTNLKSHNKTSEILVVCAIQWRCLPLHPSRHNLLVFIILYCLVVTFFFFFSSFSYIISSVCVWWFFFPQRSYIGNIQPVRERDEDREWKRKSFVCPMSYRFGFYVDVGRVLSLSDFQQTTKMAPNPF